MEVRCQSALILGSGAGTQRAGSYGQGWGVEIWAGVVYGES